MTAEALEAVESATFSEVRLVGRLAAAADARELPSGSSLVSFRVVVDRPRPAKPVPPRTPTVDTIDCVVRSGGNVRRTVQAWGGGDVVEIEGTLRRRFWRSAGGPASRTEVEVVRAKRLTKAS
jgi:single-strand DNA-binding protein